MAQRSTIRRLTYWLTARMLQLAGAIFLGMRYRGRENLPREGGALVCSNHQSYFDPVLFGACCPRHINYVARETLFRGPWGWILAWFYAIPIQREGSGIAGIRESLRRLKRGEMLLIFPEGTRTPHGEMQPLQPGFIALARRAQVPIVPVALDGAYQAWPRTQRWPHAETIRWEMGIPLSPDEIALMDDAALITEVAQRIQQCFQSAAALRRP